MIGDKNMELKSNIAGMVNVETVNGEIDIKNTSFLSGTNKYVDISKLFNMILEENKFTTGD